MPTHRCLQVGMIMSPRIASFMHPEYLKKYYESTPASWAAKQQQQQQQQQQGGGSSNGPTQQDPGAVLPWTELFNRMAARAEPPASSSPGNRQSQVQGPKDVLKKQQQSSGSSTQSSTAAAGPVYEWYHVTRMWPRTWSGFGAFWSLDPNNPAAIEAMKQVCMWHVQQLQGGPKVACIRAHTRCHRAF
jgi:hypothetical protein